MLVRGTQEVQPAILEFGKDTVYVRRNVKRVEGPEVGERQGFSGWEYEEEQYTYPEYVKKQKEESDDVKLALVELAEMIGG